MSVREEDRQKNSCPSRGLGIAAAAIGVGVGAALYYFFNKRQENSSSEGSSSDWTYERQQTFPKSESDDSYTTISEHETSDTSMHSSVDSNTSFTPDNSVMTVDTASEEESSTEDSGSHFESDSESESDDDSEIDSTFNIISDSVYISTSIFETGYSSLQNALSSGMASDSENTEWDITTSSLGVPEERSRSPMFMLLGRIRDVISPRRKITEDEQMTILRQQAFRERSWTLEECSICFDVMLRNQEVTALPCAHNFHTECILPWLQEKQTCPNCRKVAE